MKRLVAQNLAPQGSPKGLEEKMLNMGNYEKDKTRMNGMAT